MFVVRPTPSDAQVKAMTNGRAQKGLNKYGPSRSWWDKGALVVDDQGPAMVDADGCRVPIPVPPVGGSVVQFGTIVTMPGPSAVFETYSVCDRDDRELAALPLSGFTEEDFKRFATAAGLAYRVRMEKGSPPRLPGFVTLWPCTHDEAFRKTHRQRWLLRKILRSREEWDPYYGGRTYPPMDPAYLAA